MIGSARLRIDPLTGSKTTIRAARPEQRNAKKTKNRFRLRRPLFYDCLQWAIILSKPRRLPGITTA